jgi:hypothetical protein
MTLKKVTLKVIDLYESPSRPRAEGYFLTLTDEAFITKRVNGSL